MAEATEVEAGAYSVSTVERAIDMLETFSPQAPELGLVEIAAPIADYLAGARLVAYTPTTIVAPEALRAEIARIRRQGLAEGWDERNSGGAGAAAPIYGAADTVVGAVAVAVPTGRYSRELKKRTVATVAEAAVAISAAIGARPGRLLRSRGRRRGR